jgi:hydrogenase maturation protein HypF
MQMLAEPRVVRLGVRVHGTVQGVGFRPFVHRLAGQLALSGWVCNDAAGVALEVQGEAARAATFLERLVDEAPPLARVERIEPVPRPLVAGEAGFSIRASTQAGPVATAVTADAGTCDACLTELFDPEDRRYRYAFVNCTHCGPRYSITRALPYDRATTSMAPFAQCPACLREYESPADRRFHAEPNACPVCGPRLTLLDASGAPVEGDPLAAAVARLAAGEIVAIKGLGGFHLAADARNADAVARLRSRKQREEKPFAVMVAAIESVRLWVGLDAADAALLASPEQPIVLLRKREGTDDALPGVAPGLAWLGVMLPYTPLQHLLFHEAAGRPAGLAWRDAPQPFALVMTSANPGGEPLVIGNDEALERLRGIADAFLIHDRDIVARCDDSVVRRAAGGAPQFVRRARGYTPRPIRLDGPGPSVLATGAWLKNTVCITRGDEAFLSPHIGDLDSPATCRALAETVDHLCSVLDVQPAAVVHDRHPDFFSTRFAAEYAQRAGVPRHAVQHHHAHIAAVVAEHRHAGPVIGLALDGVGLGEDGGAWGGELLVVDGARTTRIGHLRPLALPGGDRAAREPWRMAAAALHALGRGAEITRRYGRHAAAGAVRHMLARGLRCPQTSSAGRWFDAAAGLLGVRDVAAFEGQAPMLLEGLAERHGPAAPRPELVRQAGTLLDPAQLLAALADADDPPEAAALFHATLAHGLAAWVAEAARTHRVDTVALGGGCFLNALLTRDLCTRLTACGLHVLEAAAAPPNDGGIALGQAWIGRKLTSASTTGLAPRSVEN